MVTFKTKKIKTAKATTKRRAIWRKIQKKKRTFSKYLLKFLLILVLFSTIGMIIGLIVLYNKIIKPLPPITKLKDMDIAQTSSIYDRKGNLLYSVYKEKRTYIEFDKINSKMINAIIAWEDKRFWTNPWFDLIGLARAWLTAATTWEQIEGTSTISQQLIKNTFLTNERKIERKIKEIYLSYKLTNAFSKEKIIELYLNKISFGNNAYWIEQAALTYFDKPASELIFLESAILASLPKWPTYYSPYSHADRLMGYPYVYPVNATDWIKNESEKAKAIEESQIKILSQEDGNTYTKEITALKSLVKEIKIKRLKEDWDNILACGLKKENFKKYISIDGSGCSVITYSELLPLLNDIRIQVWDNYIEYQTWRKDFILWRMLEDGYLKSEEAQGDPEYEFRQYQKSFNNGILFEFKRIKERIKYPHFVFYVKEYLEEKYGKKVMEEWGLKIITTLDPEKQDAAQAIIDKHAAVNNWKYWANNAASITLNNKNGEIVTMVWWKDYYNKEIAWENNIITSKLQPGSTFKPFVYALAMEKNQIGPKTPVFDVKTTFPGSYEPNNFDGKFMKKMSIEEALNYSRNIPAVKMYYLAWKEKWIIDFMKELWVESYYDFKKYYRKKYGKEYNYGAPMSLGTWELTPLELAKAYSTVASLGKKKEVTPILKIYDSKGVPIELPEQRSKPSEAISPSTAYLVTSILKNTKARPATWNKYMTIPDREMAAKTWTSTKQFKINWEKQIYPQNVWTIGYTPQFTTVAWAWNTNGKQLYEKASWLMTAWPILRDTMTSIHKGTKAEEWARPNSIKEVTISTNSWKLPTASTPRSARVAGLFINAPTGYDNSYFSQKVDALCNGRVTADTPADAIKYVSWVNYRSLQPDNQAWEAPVRRLYGFWNQRVSSRPCERSWIPSNMELWINISNGWSLIAWSNYVELSYRSSNPIVRITIFLAWKQLASYELPWNLEGGYRWAFNVPSWLTWNETLTVKAIDNQFYSKTISKWVVLWWRDTVAPAISLQNPARGSINLEAWQNFNLRANISDSSTLRSVNVYFNWKTIASQLTTRNLVVPISTAWLPKWTYTAKIDATDMHFNTSSKVINVNVISWEELKQPTKEGTTKETKTEEIQEPIKEEVAPIIEEKKAPIKEEVKVEEPVKEETTAVPEKAISEEKIIEEA